MQSRAAKDRPVVGNYLKFNRLLLPGRNVDLLSLKLIGARLFGITPKKPERVIRVAQVDDRDRERVLLAHSGITAFLGTHLHCQVVKQLNLDDALGWPRLTAVQGPDADDKRIVAG